MCEVDCVAGKGKASVVALKQNKGFFDMTILLAFNTYFCQCIRRCREPEFDQIQETHKAFPHDFLKKILTRKMGPESPTLLHNFSSWIFKRVAQRYSLLGAAFISDAFDRREKEDKVERYLEFSFPRPVTITLVMGTSQHIESSRVSKGPEPDP